MGDSRLLKRFTRKNVNVDRIAATVGNQPALLPEIFEGLGADTAAVRFGCLKVLRIVSERKPAVLYPRIRTVIDLLDSDNQIVKWGGIHVIGNLAAVDSRGEIDRILNKYLAPIPGPVLVTAANVIGGAAKIAQAKPALADRIVGNILKVEKARYKTPECRNVAAGHAIEALSRLYPQTGRKKQIAAFVRRQLRSRRPATRKKAEKFVKQWLDS